MKKWMLKLLSLASVSCMLLVGCSSNSGGAQPAEQAEGDAAQTQTQNTDAVKITFINGFTGGDGAFMRKITDGFNASQDQYFVEELQDKEHYTKFKTASYDMVVIHGGLLPTYSHDGMIRDIADIYDAAGLSLDDFHSAGQNLVLIDGEPYAMPLDIHPLTMFYNKDLSPEAPQTLDDLRALNEQLQQEDENLYALGIPSMGLVEYYMLAMCVQNDIDLVQDGYLNFATDEFADSLLAWNKMIYEDGISPANLGIDGEFKIFVQSEDSDTSAQAAVALTGPWYLDAARETFGDSLGIAGIPALGNHEGGYGNSHTIAVSADVTDQAVLDGIAEFFKYMYQPEVLANWAEGGQAPLHLATIDYIGQDEEKYELAYANSQQFDTIQGTPQVYNFTEQMRYMNEVVFTTVTSTEGLTREALMAELETATKMAQEIAAEA